MKKFQRLFITAVLLAIFSVHSVAQNAQEGNSADVQADSVTTAALDMFNWKSFDEAKEQAKEDQKKILIYVNARWCGYCKKMEKQVFVEEKVQEITEKYFHPVWIDVDETDQYLTFRNQKMSQSQFANSLQAYSTPTFVFFDENINPIAAQPGFMPEDIYTQILEYVGTSAYKEQTFNEFSEME